MDYRKSLMLFSLVVAVAIGSVLTSRQQLCFAQSPDQRIVNLDNPAVPFSKMDTLLHIQDSKIEVNGELLFSVVSETAGNVIWFYSPRYGRFIFSTRPHPKYEFEEVEVIDNHRISFRSGGKQFEWIVKTPLAETGTISHLWMMHDRHPEPLKDKPKAGGEIGASSHYEYILP